ncbi:MAG: chorismate synthase [Erysipelotrichaceae bacterium]
MKNITGNQIQLTIFGESHSELMGITINGFPCGIKIEEEFINQHLQLRQPSYPFNTSRNEKDQFEIVSGVFNNYSTGMPITIIIPNKNQNSKEYNSETIRPSHCDYSTKIKYQNYNDYRGGGAFSGRLSALLVAAGSIFINVLQQKNINIITHIYQYNDLIDEIDMNNLPNYDKTDNLVVFDPIMKEQIINNLLQLQDDSHGATLQTIITNLPVGIGEPYFDSFESHLSSLIFSIGGVKGISFGLGFDFAHQLGSTSNDEFYYDENQNIKTFTNNNGGINGGITNGMPVYFKTAIKPTPSISKIQKTINLTTKQNTNIKIEGRHDRFLPNRIIPVINALSAFAICDLGIEAFGKEWLKS